GNDVLCFAEHIEDGIQHILKNATEIQINKSIERIWQLKEKAILNEDSTLKLTDPSSLNRKIAENSLTLHHGTAAEITAFKTTNFCTLTIKRFGADQTKQDILDNILEMKKEVEQETEILLLLTPPQVKPTNNFGFFDAEIDFINELIASKNVVLYHFGNPYALKFFNTEKTTATIIAYQNFKEFQDVATEHFLGSIEAKGKLPVALK
ncbi:MAG: glycoside hydrolase family 3 protein, partial [Maribacter sp.]|nr:glycoside hydrolase family 3 protein [Maribacter sp.]